MMANGDGSISLAKGILNVKVDDWRTHTDVDGMPVNVGVHIAGWREGGQSNVVEGDARRNPGTVNSTSAQGPRLTSLGI